MEKANFASKCLSIRQRIVDILEYGRRGHIGSAFSLVEILTTLYFHTIDTDKVAEGDFYRDRIILSKGHGCLALYAILWDLNLISDSHIKNIYTEDSILAGHPTLNPDLGIEASSGSLGQGASIGLGMALGLKYSNSNSKVYVILGDGELNEGSIWEAFMSAGNKNLSNLIFIIDYNKYQSYGTTKEVCDLEPLFEKLKSFKLVTSEINLSVGSESLIEELQKNVNSPRAIICHTQKGQGCHLTLNNLDWHHVNNISDDQISALRSGLIS